MPPRVQPSTTRPTELRLPRPRPSTAAPLRLARRRRCRHRGSHGRHQQRGRVRCLHHNLATQLYAGCFAPRSRSTPATRGSYADGDAGKRIRLPRELCVLRAADRGHMLLRPGDGDTLGRSGNDPTHYFRQRAIFCLAAGIPTILPVDSAGCDGLLLRMEKAARLASLAAAGGSLRRPGASLWLRRRRDVAPRLLRHACSDGHHFDGDRNRNLGNPTGNGDNYSHGQLGP